MEENDDNESFVKSEFPTFYKFFNHLIKSIRIL